MFTINNPDELQVPLIKKYCGEFAHACAYGLEVGALGTPHIQGYMKLMKQTALSALKKVFPAAHFDACNSPSLAWEYCLKGSQTHEEWDERGTQGPNYGVDYAGWSFGEKPEHRGAAGGRGTKRKWDEARLACKEDRLDDIDASIFIQHYNNLKRIRDDERGNRSADTLDWDNSAPPNEWIWGESGVGKSSSVRERFPDCYTKDCQTKWWPNYHDEEVVHIEDVLPEHTWMVTHLLKWSDRYPFQAEVKAGHTGIIRPKRIIVTSMYPPEDLCKDSEQLKALRRRFKIKNMIKIKKNDALGEEVRAHLGRQGAEYFADGQDELRLPQVAWVPDQDHALSAAERDAVTALAQIHDINGRIAALNQIIDM